MTASLMKGFCSGAQWILSLTEIRQISVSPLNPIGTSYTPPTTFYLEMRSWIWTVIRSYNKWILLTPNEHSYDWSDVVLGQLCACADRQVFMFFISIDRPLTDGSRGPDRKTRCSCLQFSASALTNGTLLVSAVTEVPVLSASLLNSH